MTKVKFITKVVLDNVPAGTLLDIVELKDANGDTFGIRYEVPNTNILFSEAEIRAKEDLFSEVPKIHFGCLKGLVETSRQENEIYFGEDFMYFSTKDNTYVKTQFTGTSEQIAMLAVGFGVSLPTNTKQLYNRLERLNRNFNLGFSESQVFEFAGKSVI